MNSIVTASGVTFELPNGRELFLDLSFSLNNHITALVGPNGVGKTTLAKLLTGELEPSRGLLQRHAPLTYFPQRSEPPAISVDEFLTLDYSWSAFGEKLLEGIERQALCTTLSGGQWMRVRLARTLDEQYLILDEPTNDLDRGGRELLIDFLRSRKGGVLLISHDRECLELCDNVLELSNRGLAKYGGGWTSYLEQKETERANLSSALEASKRDRTAAISDRNEARARQAKRQRQGAKDGARGGIPKILLGTRKRNAQATAGKVDADTLERKDAAIRSQHEALSEIKIDPIMYADLVGMKIPEQKLVAEAAAFNIRFQDWIYPQDLNFIWRGNIRLALKGENGSGKSTLLKSILAGPSRSSHETRGSLKPGHLVSLYIDQRCAILDDDKSIFENVCDVTSLTESEIRSGLARFLFTKDSVFQKVKDLSGGERLRAALARGFLSNERPELLVLDEPTNNLDLANVEFLEGLVREFRGALIVISHDQRFLKNCEITEEFFVG